MQQKDQISLILIFLVSLSLITCQLVDTTPQPVKAQTQTQIYGSTFIDLPKYYYYQISQQKNTFYFSILNSNLTRETLNFTRRYPLYYRASYHNFIILEEKRRQDDTINYWVIQIVETKTGHKLDVFPVNATVDNEGLQIDNSYLLESIVEYSEKNKILYVRLVALPETYVGTDSNGDTGVYAINVGEKRNRLIAINWFNYNKKDKQRIVGGNSRVLVQAYVDELWIDTNNTRKNFSDPTIFEKYVIIDLTDLPIYRSNSHAKKLRQTYFQYYSFNIDEVRMTSFLYEGYNLTPVMNEDFITSKERPIRIWGDDWSFFLAVSDQDAYWTVVSYNAKTKKYTAKSGTWTNLTIQDISDKREYLTAFNDAVQIVNHEGKFFVLTKQKFYVLENKILYQKLLHQEIGQFDDIHKILFEQMKAYYATL